MVLGLAFGIGLVSSLHCVGMCGPIALAIPVGRQSKGFTYLLYHGGRILAYASLGTVFGLVGEQLAILEWQNSLAIAFGSIILITVLTKKLLGKGLGAWGIRLAGSTLGKMGRNLKVGGYERTFYLGFLNGYLPCGMVYFALAGALGCSSSMQGAVFMLLFGLGTIPLLIALQLSSTWLTGKVRRTITKVIPFFQLLVGVLLIARGFGVGLPHFELHSLFPLFTKGSTLTCF